jgi:hypothetical protein
MSLILFALSFLSVQASSADGASLIPYFQLGAGNHFHESPELSPDRAWLAVQQVTANEKKELSFSIELYGLKSSAVKRIPYSAPGQQHLGRLVFYENGKFLRLNYNSENEKKYIDFDVALSKPIGTGVYQFPNDYLPAKELFDGFGDDRNLTAVFDRHQKLQVYEFPYVPSVAGQVTRTTAIKIFDQFVSSETHVGQSASNHLILLTTPQAPAPLSTSLSIVYFRKGIVARYQEKETRVLGEAVLVDDETFFMGDDSYPFGRTKNIWKVEGDRIIPSGKQVTLDFPVHGTKVHSVARGSFAFTNYPDILLIDLQNYKVVNHFDFSAVSEYDNHFYSPDGSIIYGLSREGIIRVKTGLKPLPID